MLSEKRRSPITPSQKRLVAFMILHPEKFEEFEKHGGKECLAGCIGEVLYFQLREMLARQETVEPEDLLGSLPEGEEKELVMQVLLDAPDMEQSGEEAEESGDSEAFELLSWMKRTALQKAAERILQQISEAERSGDYAKLTELIMEKVRVEQELRSEEL